MKAEGWAEQALLWSESKPNGLSGGGHHLSKYLSQRMKVSFELGLRGAELCCLPPSRACSFNDSLWVADHKVLHFVLASCPQSQRRGSGVWMRMLRYSWQEPESTLVVVFSSDASGCRGAVRLGQSPRLFKVWSLLSKEEAEPFPLGVRVLSNRCAVAGGVKER